MIAQQELRKMLMTLKCHTKVACCI